MISIIKAYDIFCKMVLENDWSIVGKSVEEIGIEEGEEGEEGAMGEEGITAEESRKGGDAAEEARKGGDAVKGVRNESRKGGDAAKGVGNESRKGGDAAKGVGNVASRGKAESRRQVELGSGVVSRAKVTTGATMVEGRFEQICRKIGVSPVDLSEVIRNELGISGAELLRG